MKFSVLFKAIPGGSSGVLVNSEYIADCHIPTKNNGGWDIVFKHSIELFEEFNQWLTVHDEMGSDHDSEVLRTVVQIDVRTMNYQLYRYTLTGVEIGSVSKFDLVDGLFRVGFNVLDCNLQVINLQTNQNVLV